MNEVLWRPSEARIKASRMDAFRREVNRRHGVTLADYDDLHRWSIDQRAAFWQTLADYFQVRWHQPATEVLIEG
ncbi:MAG: acetyl-coenzyme A synthetase N-terminal domain-containing protein, partial [Pseudomonas sp.]